MKLPHRERALVDRQKVHDYLLNPSHPDNGGKGMFFQSLGFRRGDWHLLADALRQLASTGEVVVHVKTPHGTKFVVDGRMETLVNKLPVVRTVWIVEHGLDIPRLVTAYPGEE